MNALSKKCISFWEVLWKNEASFCNRLVIMATGTNEANIASCRTSFGRISFKNLFLLQTAYVRDDSTAGRPLAVAPLQLQL
eukprot:2213851-Amphidinium_carterae.1